MTMVAAKVHRENGAPGSVAVADLSEVLPRVLIVSRRTVRKNKFVDFVGEYHLDLIVKYGACPVIVPRVTGLQSLLNSFEPIHGVLLCEGEDIDPSLYESEAASLSPAEMEEIREAHSADAATDHAKDSIELQLARRCLERSIPFLGICRGSQVLNVACGGSLYTDVEMELSKKKGCDIKHIDYLNYDGHRHPISVVRGSPLFEWFQRSLEAGGHGEELRVNSYHHQGVRRLAPRFTPMAHAPDGLIEAFYDPDCFAPEAGKFIVGLQFHPERMRHDHEEEGRAAAEAAPEQVFDYPECPRAYQEFITAVIAYQRRLTSQDSSSLAAAAASDASLPRASLRGSMDGPPGSESRRGPLLEETVERQRRDIVRSFSLARQVYDEQLQLKRNPSVHNSSQALQALTLKRTNSQQDLSPGAEFLQENTALGSSAVRRLKAMGATVRNSSLALLHLQKHSQPAEAAHSAPERQAMGSLSEEELRELLVYHERMARAAEEVLRARAGGGGGGGEGLSLGGGWSAAPR